MNPAYVSKKVPRPAKREHFCLLVWPSLLIGNVTKQPQQKHMVEVVYRMAQGLEEHALELLADTFSGYADWKDFLRTAYLVEFAEDANMLA